jgi:DNA-binding LacI/PurR family transcriptional regulator
VPPTSGDGGPAASPPRRATSVDVARLAGVSRATVSHVLNDQVDRFSQHTVEHVRNAAAALGYVRSAAGRALVMGRSDFVMLVVPYTTFTNLQDIVEVISADIEDLGFTLVVHFSGDGAAGGGSSARLRHTVETLRPAGLVDLGGLSEGDMEVLRRSGCPILPPRSGAYGTATFHEDGNVWIGRMQAEHLYARGYTRLAYARLLDRREDPYGRIRADSFAAFCAAMGLAPPVRVEVPLTPDGTAAALDQFVAAAGTPLGLACFSDEVAVALLFAALGRGLAVPADLAVIGVERSKVGQLVSPRLTTVSPNVPASLSAIRSSIAQAYGGTPRPPVPPPGREVFCVVQGETT